METNQVKLWKKILISSLALIGLGVLFELMWNNSNNEIKDTILTNIKKGLNS